jgi:2-dehydropantoate 2-reductase
MVESENARPPRVLVVGCGGIGGIVATALKEMDVDVAVVTGNEEIASAVRTRGARVREDGAERTVTGIRTFTSLPMAEEAYDFVLLATQPPAVEAAARSVAHALKQDGRVVCFQNGLCEARVAAIMGPDRVVGGIVAWGASQVEPGLYERTASGGFALGRFSGPVDDRLSELARLLECVGPVDITQNLMGARWSKLAINCGISALGTIGGERLGVLMRHRFVRRLCLELMTEVVHVARAENVRLEKVSGTLDLEWIALTDGERNLPLGSPNLFAKHTLLLAVGARYRRLRSSMLSAIERGRPPAVDQLNGEVVQRASPRGLRVPVNAEAQTLIHRIARKEARPSMDLLREFFDGTKAVRNS